MPRAQNGKKMSDSSALIAAANVIITQLGNP
jgi:hypothetical protein